MPYQREIPRRSSVPWDRLRPAKQDPLESFGYVSRGDNRLLSSKNQESYYHKITARYMQFCAHNAKNLDEAFASLITNGGESKNSDSASLANNLKTLSINDGARPITPATASSSLGTSKWAVSQPVSNSTDPAEELEMILTALRKLREGILGSARIASTPVFAQRVYVFNVRLAILAHHPESYHAPLRYLLSKLHNHERPLPESEMREMLSYLILDTALRLGQFNEAYTIRLKAKTIFGFRDRNLDLILKAVVTDDWPLFWLLRGRVDGYIRAIMHWRLETLRTSVLKAIGRSYMRCDADWILQNAVGGEMSWADLVNKEDIGWTRDGNTVTIRKPKIKS